VIAVAIIAALGCLTWRQSHIYISAESLWRDTQAKNPDSWMVNTNLAHVLRDKGTAEALDEAEHLYNRALELAPYLHDTHTNVGMMDGMRGHNEAALRELDEALKINPTFAPAYYTRGQVLARMGKTDEAIDDFNLALHYAPDYAEAHYRLALALEEKANEAKARAIKTKNLADAAEWQKNLLAAIDHLRRAVTDNNDYAEAHYELGNCLISIEQYDEAIWNLQQAVRINDNYAEAWTSLGGAELAANHPLDAIRDFTKALQIDPNLEPAKRGLQAARARLGMQ
jgi:tetratricopeptide (TPR) repeat protein